MKSRRDRNLHTSKPQHEELYQDLCKVLAKHSGGMTSLEMLAVAANMVGKILAMQDQTAVTVSSAMEVIAKNIEYGNRTVVDGLRSGPVSGHS